MKEPHEKGVAIRSAPSFALGAAKCSVKRKQGKRWAGYQTSKICNQGADAITTAEGYTSGSAIASCWAALRTPCKSGNAMHENRETLEIPEADHCNRSAGEGKSRTARAHVFEESDSGTVPMNHSNKSGKPPAESEEGRPLITQNTHQSNTLSTQSEARVSPGVGGCAQGSEETEGDEVYCLARPFDDQSATTQLLRSEAKGCFSSRRCHVAGV